MSTILDPTLPDRILDTLGEESGTDFGHELAYHLLVGCPPDKSGEWSCGGCRSKMGILGTSGFAWVEDDSLTEVPSNISKLIPGMTNARFAGSSCRNQRAIAGRNSTASAALTSAESQIRAVKHMMAEGERL